MAHDPATVRYAKLAYEWCQKAECCPVGEERDVFLTIADGYDQLVRMLEASDKAGEHPDVYSA